MLRAIARWVAVLLLGATTIAGAMNTVGGFESGQTGLQQSVAFAVALYSVLGALALVGLFRRRPWTVTVAVAWGIACTWAASVASFAFHDPTFSQQGTIAGVLGSGVACLLMTWFVVWVARYSTRPQIPTT